MRFPTDSFSLHIINPVEVSEPSSSSSSQLPHIKWNIQTQTLWTGTKWKPPQTVCPEHFDHPLTAALASHWEHIFGSQWNVPATIGWPSDKFGSKFNMWQRSFCTPAVLRVWVIFVCMPSQSWSSVFSCCHPGPTWCVTASSVSYKTFVFIQGVLTETSDEDKAFHRFSLRDPEKTKM